MIQFTSKNSGFVVSFTILILLNFGLGLYLLNTASAQNTEPPKQEMIKAKVEYQMNVPMDINLGSIDNSAVDLQTIHYVGVNLTSKPIYAYVLMQADSAGTGKVLTNYSPKGLEPGKRITDAIYIERTNVKPGGEVFLSIDYVEFVDGTFWGADTQKQSERIGGFRAGRARAISHIGNLLATNKLTLIVQILEKEISAVMLPETPQDNSDLWQSGYRTGYRSVVSILKNAFDQGGSEAISGKFGEIVSKTKR